MLRGVGRSGKGVALRLLTDLLGGERYVLNRDSPAKLAGRFTFGQAAEKAALIVYDCPQTPTLRSAAYGPFMAGLGVVKSLAGGDPIDCEQKHGDQWTARYPIVPWLATNFALSWAHSAADSEAWTERLLPVVYPASIPASERQADYEAVILAGDGREALAAYFIGCYAAACRRGVKVNGLGALPAFTMPASSIAKLQAIAARATGGVGEFVAGKVAYRPGSWTSRADLRAALKVHLGDQEPSRKHLLDLFPFARLCSYSDRLAIKCACRGAARSC